MKQIRNFADANTALAKFIPNSRTDGSYSLERPRKLMGYLGDPQNQLKIIHVAGTSGKTSTSYYAAAMLKSAGKKVGLTVSPHIDEVNDRVQIDLMPMPEAEFCNELFEFLQIVEASGINPSYFECLIAFAFWEFAKQSVDYAVIEVGLGGLLDGTNVINRLDKVCIITDIGLDHVRVLGNTLPEIAFQKAGIINPHNEVFSYRQADEITKVFERQCARQQANLNLIDLPVRLPDNLKFLPLFQQHNFALAEKAINFILKRDRLTPLSSSQVKKAAETHIPARMEVFDYKDKIIILDGAHNAQKLQALVESIKSKYPDQTVAAIVSFSVLNADSRLNDGLNELSKLIKYAITTEFGVDQDIHQQSVNPELVMQVCKELGLQCKIVNDPINAIKELLARPEKILLVTGSFYLLNPIRPYVLGLKND